METLASRLVEYVGGDAREYATLQIMKDQQSMLEVINNPACPAWLLARMAESTSSAVQAAVAGHRNTDLTTLEKLTAAKTKKVSTAAKKNILVFRKAPTPSPPPTQALSAEPSDVEESCALVEEAHFSLDDDALRATLQKFSSDLVTAIETGAQPWEAQVSRVTSLCAGELLAALATKQSESEEFHKLLADTYTAVINSLENMITFDSNESDYILEDIATLRRSVSSLLENGNLPTSKAFFATVAKLANLETPLQELASQLTGYAGLAAPGLRASLAYLHPNADLTLQALAPTIALGDLPPAVIAAGNGYGTKDHAEMVFEKFPPNSTLILLEDTSIDWQKIVGPDNLARTLAQAIGRLNYVPDESDYTRYMTLPVAKELVRSCEWELFYWLVYKYQTNGILTADASYNKDLCEVDDLREFWNAVPPERVGEMSAFSLWRALEMQYMHPGGERNVELALEILGVGIGSDRRGFIAAEGLIKTFPGSIMELSHAVKEAVIVAGKGAVETPKPRKGAPAAKPGRSPKTIKSAEI